ncbi:hypothetical protein GCM10009563_13890 [Subtercola frigoramans]
MFGRNDLHGMPCKHEAPDDADRLVGSNTPGDSDDDVHSSTLSDLHLTDEPCNRAESEPSRWLSVAHAEFRRATPADCCAGQGPAQPYIQSAMGALAFTVSLSSLIS